MSDGSKPLAGPISSGDIFPEPVHAVQTGRDLRWCGFCHSWNSKPCGDGCQWWPGDPTVEDIKTHPDWGIDKALQAAYAEGRKDEREAFEATEARLHSMLEQLRDVASAALQADGARRRPLSDDDIEAIAMHIRPITQTGHPSWEHAVARAIERAHGIGNNLK